MSVALVDDLLRLGVQSGDIVMVHASLRRLGPVEGGALALIAALDRAVGPDGSVMMVISAVDDGVFDPATTPADPDVGALAEVFRTAPGTFVNEHPEARFAARGARAQELIDNPPWDDYFGPRSPLERLVRLGGKVLRLGSDLDTVTLIHYAEYLAEVPGKRTVTRRRSVHTADGPVLRNITCLDDSDGIVARPGEEDYFITITRAALAAGLAAVGHVGLATAELFDARTLVAFATDWMSRHLA